jgi:cold-inducible RNA-binding protein
MGSRLYVGNLSYSTTDDKLREAFEPHGTVVSATVLLDRMSGRSRGFGFVELGSDAEAQKAILAMNGAEVDGRQLTVNEARARDESGGPRGGGARFPGRGRGPDAPPGGGMDGPPPEGGGERGRRGGNRRGGSDRGRRDGNDW